MLVSRSPPLLKGGSRRIHISAKTAPIIFAITNSSADQDKDLRISLVYPVHVEGGDLTRLDLAFWPDLAILQPFFILAQSSKLMDFNKVSFFFSFGIFTAITGWGQQTGLVMLLVNTAPHGIGIGGLDG